MLLAKMEKVYGCLSFSPQKVCNQTCQGWQQRHDRGFLKDKKRCLKNKIKMSVQPWQLLDLWCDPWRKKNIRFFCIFWGIKKKLIVWESSSSLWKKREKREAEIHEAAKNQGWLFRKIKKWEAITVKKKSTILPSLFF